MTFSPQAKKKVRAILAWYEHESQSIRAYQRLRLLKKWIDTCIRYEEYEMAVALRKVRCRLIRRLRVAKGKERGPGDTLKLLFRIYTRRFKRSKLGSKLFKQK